METKMYRVEVDLFYRQHDKNYEITKIRRTFKGKDQADVYGYIKYYALAWGMCDVKMVDEGVIGEEPNPLQDHLDTGAPTFAEGVKQTQNAIQEEIDIS